MSALEPRDTLASSRAFELALVAWGVALLGVSGGVAFSRRPASASGPPAPGSPATTTATTPETPATTESPTRLAVETFPAALVREEVQEPPPLVVDSPTTSVALEGAPDPGYSAELDAERLVGGPEPATTWRTVLELPKDHGPPLAVGTARFLALTSLGKKDLLVLDAARAEPLRVTLMDAIHYAALSGNRLLVTLRSRPALVAIDLDKGEVVATEVPLPGPEGHVITCARDPRRAYVQANGRLALIDAGRMKLVATSPPELQVRASSHPSALATDGWGRLIYVSAMGTRAHDPAHAFQVVREGIDGIPDPEGRFLFGSRVFRAGSLEPVDAPPGYLVGELADGTLLVAVEQHTMYEHRDPQTALPVGDRFKEPDLQGNRGPPLSPMILRGSNRLVRVPQNSRTLQVLDVPAGPRVKTPASRPPRLTALPSANVYLGAEWTHAPHVLEPAGAVVTGVEGPTGLTWDGTTARWRPTVEQVGARTVTIVVRTSDGATHPIACPVVVHVRTLVVPIRGITLQPRPLPSGRLVVWCTRTHLLALEPGTWRTRSVNIGNISAIAEVGDSLWLTTNDGAITELSCPELAPKSQHRIVGASPSAVAGLPDGRIGWVEPLGDPGAVRRFRLGRFRPGEPSSDVVEGVTREGPLELCWLDAERLVVTDGTWRWSASGTLERFEQSKLPSIVLPDGTAFTSELVLRPDGSTLRGHLRGTPWPSHDGRTYATLSWADDAHVRLAVYGLPDGKLLATIADPITTPSSNSPLSRGLLVVSRASTLLVWDANPYLQERTFFLVPYETGAR